MRVDVKTPPGTFRVGIGDRITIQDCAAIELDPDQMVSFVTESGTEFDVVRKDFGYYATPSLNHRLRDHGLRAALMRNRQNRFYIVLVEAGKEDLFHQYLEDEKQKLICWLDRDEDLERIVAAAQED